MMPEPTDDFQLNQVSHFSMGDKEGVNDNSNYHHQTRVIVGILKQACLHLRYIFPKSFFSSYLG